MSWRGLIIVLVHLIYVKDGDIDSSGTKFIAAAVVRSGPEAKAVKAKTVAGRRVVLRSLLVMR